MHLHCQLYKAREYWRRIISHVWARKVATFFTQIFFCLVIQLGKLQQVLFIVHAKGLCKGCGLKAFIHWVSRASDFELKLKALFFLCLQDEDTTNSGKRVYMLCRETEKVKFFSETLLTMWGKKAGCFRIKRGFNWENQHSPPFLEDCVRRQTRSVVRGVWLACPIDGSKETTGFLQHSLVKSSHILNARWTSFNEYSHHLI